MKNTLTLTKKQASFLEENRQDPITGDKFKINDKIVFCAECKSAFLKESWEYMGNRHCNQNKMLRKIPKNRKLALKKVVKVDYQIPSRRDVVVSWVVDTVIWLMIIVGLSYFSTFYSKEIYIIMVIGTLLVKDNNLITTSVGKKLRSLSMIHIKTNKKASPFLYPLRHVFSAILLLLFYYNDVNTFKGLIAIFGSTCLLDLLINFEKSRRIIDYVLGTAMTKDENIEDIDISFPDEGFFSLSDYQDPTSLDGF
ncbi:hypothetical protein ACE193_04220 [Bernardetia sp. OM2101]|uniref:hypothetical protein n=1 Tax=Bernardetia sp. OM2101 TaxID=3344876 RepID=UPI0035CE94F1